MTKWRCARRNDKIALRWSKGQNGAALGERTKWRCAGLNDKIALRWSKGPTGAALGKMTNAAQTFGAFCVR